MANTHKSDKFYGDMAKKLNEAVQPKRGFTVREAGAILGYGADNTSATLNCLRNLVRLGLVYEEKNGKYRKYYLP